MLAAPAFVFRRFCISSLGSLRDPSNLARESLQSLLLYAYAVVTAVPRAADGSTGPPVDYAKMSMLYFNLCFFVVY